MKRSLKLFTLAFALLFTVVVKVNAKEMTSSELLATVSEKTITLTEDVTLTSSLTVPSTVGAIDLGGKTLILKEGIVVNSTLEIKNGIIERDTSFTKGSMLTISGATTEFTLNGVTLDGKNVAANPLTGITDYLGIAMRATSGKTIVLKDSSIINHNYVNAAVGRIVDLQYVDTINVINTKVSNNITKAITIFGVNNSGKFVFDKDSVVSNNIAVEASGIHITNTNSSIAGTIEGNKTTKVDGNGGGLFTYLSDASKTVIIEETAIIRNNTAAAGGGIYVTGDRDVSAETGIVIMNGGLITGNKAVSEPNPTTLKDGGGAGIYVARGSMEINGGTIESNTSTSGKGDAILVSHAGGNDKAGILVVNAGYVDGTILKHGTHGSIAVLGGAFTDDVTNYIVIGTSKVEVDGVTYVGESYEVTLAKVENGKVTLSTEKAVVGQPVKLTIEADKGYKLSKAVYVGADKKEVEIKDGKFVMPEEDVTVTVAFEKEEVVPNTGDNVMLFVIIGLIGLVGATFATNKLRKNA